jgi:hypothetical protein
MSKVPVWLRQIHCDTFLPLVTEPLCKRASYHQPSLWLVHILVRNEKGLVTCVLVEVSHNASEMGRK